MKLSKAKVASKIREWVLRYLPAEIIATLTALIAAIWAHNISGSLVVSALAGTVGENIGYYGYFIIRGALDHYKSHGHHPPLRRVVLVASKTTRDMFVEFGPAELLDGLFVRPFCMYMGPRLLHNFSAGILAGKIFADLVFYMFAVVGYELKKHWFSKPGMS